MDEYEAMEKLEKMNRNMKDTEKECDEIISLLNSGLCINDEGLFVKDLSSKKEIIVDKRENVLDYVIDDVQMALNALPN